MKKLSSRARFLIAIVLLIAPGFAQAGGLGLFGGGALALGQIDLKENGVKGQFSSYSYRIEGGVTLKLGQDMSLVGIADMGAAHGYNNVDSGTYLENSSNEFSTLRTGLLISDFTVGGGLRFNDLKVKSVSSVEGSVEHKYRGELPVYFVSYNIEGDKGRGTHLSATVSIEHMSGKLDKLEYQETAISIGLTFSFIGR